MLYYFEDILPLSQKNPPLFGKVMQTANVSACQKYLELPDDFSFDGAINPPAITRGLGDFVAKIAKPIAGIIDKNLGTNIKNCGGCKARQESLNAILPFKLK